MGSNTHKSSEGEDNISFIGGKNNRFTRCEVHLADNDNRSNRHWLKISKCKAMKVDHCFFHQKESGGQFCNVSFDPEGNDVEEGPLFEYNYFLHQNFGRHVPPEKYGDAGGEAIQMGHSKQSRIFFRATSASTFSSNATATARQLQTSRAATSTLTTALSTTTVL
jgi:hypothetical protein